MIVFENQGEIDIRLAMLIGVNVKEGAAPIGFFGTGLKYAVACLARWGESLTIQSGEAEFTFASEPTEIRGKTFDLLSMIGCRDRVQLGFTTDLGKQWRPWMVYRELWSNAQDEPQPRIYEVDRAPRPMAGWTRVIADGPQMMASHNGRDEFLLGDRKLLHHTLGVDVYEGESKSVFYRGMRVLELDKPGIYTYNITQETELTEDRTVNAWSAQYAIANALVKLEEQEPVERTLLAPETALESRLDYDYVYGQSAVWKTTAEHLAHTRPMDVPKTVRSKFLRSNADVCPTCGKPTKSS